MIRGVPREFSGDLQRQTGAFRVLEAVAIGDNRRQDARKLRQCAVREIARACRLFSGKWGEMCAISPRDNNPPVSFLIISPGYEPPRQKVSLFVFFEICVAHTTLAFDVVSPLVARTRTSRCSARAVAFFRAIATCRDNLLHHILQRYCTGFCSAFLRRFLEIFGRDLKVMLHRNLWGVPEPCGDDVKWIIV